MWEQSLKCVQAGTRLNQFEKIEDRSEIRSSLNAMVSHSNGSLYILAKPDCLSYCSWPELLEQHDSKLDWAKVLEESSWEL